MMAEKSKRKPKRTGKRWLLFVLAAIIVMPFWLLTVWIQVNAPNNANSGLLVVNTVMVLHLAYAIAWHIALPRLRDASYETFILAGSLIHGITNVVVSYIAFGSAFGEAASVVWGVIGIMVGSNVGGTIYQNGTSIQVVVLAFFGNGFAFQGIIIGSLLLSPVARALAIVIPLPADFTFENGMTVLTGGLLGVIIVTYGLIRHIAGTKPNPIIYGIASGYGGMVGVIIALLTRSIAPEVISVALGVIMGALVSKFLASKLRRIHRNWSREK